MDIETYGGRCPVCKKSMLQKGDTGVTSGFEFDACPHCGFAYGTVSGKEYTAEEVWKSVFSHYKMNSREELIRELKLQEVVSVEKCEFIPAVFDYTKRGTMEHIKKINKYKF